ncbi:MAG: aminoacyl-tRNA hydrolase [Eubacteriales bacterium]
MFLIIGLGNPGLKYCATRHNIGFEVIERLSFDYNIKINQKKHKAHYGIGNINNEKVILVKPQTYMNRSGESIRSIMDFYQIDPSNIIIIYDDVSLEIGKLRFRKKGSAGGHNGIKNIIQHLNTEEFPRLKIGVGEKPPSWDLADYVLSRFSKEEIKEVTSVVKRASEAIAFFMRNKITAAMNKYNG